MKIALGDASGFRGTTGPDLAFGIEYVPPPLNLLPAEFQPRGFKG
ncbi:MAG: hypothetical protein ABIM74_00835 [candidate division WOR-3 bacterium]